MEPDTVVISTVHVNNALSHGYNFTSDVWFWISIVELAIILCLLYYKHHHDLNNDTNLNTPNLTTAKSTKIDMTNVMNSISMSRTLYKKLSKACHPDNYANTTKAEVAEELFKGISKYRTNYNQLKLLEARAEIELGINLRPTLHNE